MYMLYIDPGTGSMLFSILIGMLVTVLFFFQKAIIKLKFLFAGGKVKNTSNEKIPYVIFSDSKRYWNVFEPICDEFEARKTNLKFYTASPDDPALKKEYQYVECEFIGEGNKAFAKLNLLKANILLSTTPGLDVYQWKRSPNVDWYVHTYHAVDEGTGYRMFGLDFYDAVLLTGEFQERYIRILEEKRNLKKKEVFVTGSTYMDVLGQRVLDQRTQDKQNRASLTVLLAPSWGPSSILSVYGAKMIDALISTGYQIIIRPHPQSLISEKNIIEPLQEKYKDGEKVSWNYDNNNFEVLSRTDVMITDFSGIIYDFALAFDKPVIYADAQFDDSPYDTCWIDEETWREQALREIGIKLDEKDFDKLGSIISDLVKDETLQKGRQKIRETAWQHRNEAAGRTVDYLQEKYKQLT